MWDCAAGTGNLLAGLINKYNIWASTLDDQDVEVMRDRIKNGANLLNDHVFQFDFLNDDFAKLPKGLQEIIHDPVKRKKLVVYINPPYAEVSSKKEKGKVDVNKSKIHDTYCNILGTAGRELFTQFLVRIYVEIPGCMIGEFSTLKALQGSAFDTYRKYFLPKLEKCFVVPAKTFDNVKGSFPIGFKIWNTMKKSSFDTIDADVYNEKGEFLGQKNFSSNQKANYINKWISQFKATSDKAIGFMDGINGNDFQHNNIVYITNTKGGLPNPRGIWINTDNLIPVAVYHAVRHCMEATWLNDRDQFLFPNDKWKKDFEFQNDCLAYSLFHNNIKVSLGINHWIPFTEMDIDAKEKFDSKFMTDFIAGKIKKSETVDLFNEKAFHRTEALEFSVEAREIFTSGKKLWKYYHQQVGVNVNASLRDIRDHFQGKNNRGKINAKSLDANYTELSNDLREKLNIIKDKIASKVYEYEFLKE